MSKDITSIEITPKVVDLGASIVPLASVTRAGVVVQHPLQTPGTWLLVIAGVLLAFDASPFGSGLKLLPRPSVLMWMVCGLTSLAVFMLAYARRRFVIATADGGKVVLPQTDAQFSAAVTNCIREAIEHGTAAGPHYRIDLAQKSIATLAPAPAGAVASGAAPGLAAGETGAGASAAIVVPGAGAALPGAQGPARAGGFAGMPGLGMPGGVAGPAGMAAGAFGHVRDTTGPTTGPPTGPQANGAYRNGNDAPHGTDLLRRLDGVIGGQQPQGAPQMNGLGMPGALPAGRPGGVPGGLAAPATDDGGLRDLAFLMQVVDRANLQHKEALLDLLRVVEDHKRGGPTSPEDARAHWQSFAEYVQQYLGNVDGLPEATLRFGRAMGKDAGVRL